MARRDTRTPWHWLKAFVKGNEKPTLNRNRNYVLKDRFRDLRTTPIYRIPYYSLLPFDLEI